ncbi:sporulation protein Cse60 [Enterococcus casseliflavus]
MQVEMISSTLEASFESELNRILTELTEEGKEVIDIKYQTAALLSNDIPRINHSALIFYK